MSTIHSIQGPNQLNHLFTRPAAPPRARRAQANTTTRSQATTQAGAQDTPQSAPSAPLKISSANRWMPPVSRIAPTCARELSKTACVRRSDDPVPLPYAQKALDIAGIKAADGHPSLSDLLARGAHDGFLVLHKGTVVAEHTTGGFDPRLDTHSLNSASKVAVACIAGMLVGEGKLDLATPLETYVPEAARTGYRGVTIQQALDMQSGVELDPFDEFYAMGEHPKQGDHEAIGIYRLALTRQQPAQQQPLHYNSVCTDTDMVGIACERVTNKPYKKLLGELWSKIGAAENADLIVDDYRTPVYNGGLVPTLHDTGRLGLMLANHGRVGDQQVVPEAFVKNSRTLTPQLQGAYKGTFYGQPWPGVAYHNTFFIDANRPDVTVNYGAFGNLLVVDHKADMVGVLMSAWAKPNEDVMQWIGAFNAIGDTLAQQDC